MTGWVVYKDATGKVVLERSVGNYDTYYVYDDMDRLCFVLPPCASDALASTGLWSMNSNEILHDYAYYYHYDSRGRLTKTIENNLMDGYNTTVITYTFTNQPATVTFTHTASGKLTQTGLSSVIHNGKPALTTSYGYNVRSWITSLNNPLYSQTLTYGYGGNINTQ